MFLIHFQCVHKKKDLEFDDDNRDVNTVQYCHVQADLMHTLSFTVQ